MQRLHPVKIWGFTLALALLFSTSQAVLAQSTIDLVVHYVEGLPAENEIAYDVNVYLSVVDSVGNPVKDLTTESFTVTEDSQKVDVTSLELAKDEPINIVLVMDTSGSMSGAPLTEAAEAARTFVEGLPPSANVAVLSFGNAPVALTAMGATRAEATAALGSLHAAGETALYDAVIAAADLFSDTPTRRIMVVLSDGGDTVSTASLGGAVAAIVASEVEVHAVALDTPESSLVALEALSSGSVTLASGASALADAYATVALEVAGHYRLSFAAPSDEVIEFSIFVNGPVGVLVASQRLDLSTGMVSPGLTSPTVPDDFGADESEPPAAEVTQPDRLDEPWTLPAGVAMVFVGALAVLWLTSRHTEEPQFDPLEGMQVKVSARGGLLVAAGKGARDLGDRLVRRSRAGAIDGALDRAGIALRPGEFVVVAATGVVVGVTAGLVVAGLVGAVLFGAAAALAPRVVVRTRTERRRRAFADQLEGTLQTIAGSLRAGYGLLQAISTVASESPTPTSVEFNRIVVENRLGRSVEDSLAAMARRLENEDLGWVVEAIEIQREVGGNLAEVLDTVTATIRDRNLIRRQVRALSAEGRLSGYILVALPIVIGAFIAVISPDYLSELTGTTVGRVMLGVASLLMLGGALWIRKIVRVEF